MRVARVCALIYDTYHSEVVVVSVVIVLARHGFDTILGSRPVTRAGHSTWSWSFSSRVQWGARFWRTKMGLILVCRRGQASGSSGSREPKPHRPHSFRSALASRTLGRTGNNLPCACKPYSQLVVAVLPSRGAGACEPEGSGAIISAHGCGEPHRFGGANRQVNARR